MADGKEGGWDVEAARQNYGRFRSSGRGAAEHGAPLEAADADVEGDGEARESPIGEGDGSAVGE
ncbi:MAG: hypothetical protein QOH86_1121 [Sphingomonadales bacterium]|jgi:hypothetical protein|nr:hypothetical protein [Sphingomonadales bacterium]